MLTRRAFLAGAAAGAIGAGAAVRAKRLPGIGAATGDQPAERLAVPTRKRWATQSIGTSVQGRPIVMHRNTTWGFDVLLASVRRLRQAPARYGNSCVEALALRRANYLLSREFDAGQDR